MSDTFVAVNVLCSNPLEFNTAMTQLAAIQNLLIPATIGEGENSRRRQNAYVRHDNNRDNDHNTGAHSVGLSRTNLTSAVVATQQPPPGSHIILKTLDPSTTIVYFILLQASAGVL